MKETITSKEDAVTFASSLRLDHGERKRHREVSKHKNEPKRKKKRSYENNEEHENYFVSHD